MKIFITGATGFIGRNLARRLVAQNHEVICGGRSFGKFGLLLEKVKRAYIDLENKETILDLLRRERPDIVYHCAALVKSRSPEKLRWANVAGTENLLDACLAEGIKKVIYLSTVAVVCGNPEVPLTEDLPYKATDPYGQSKIEAEKIALDYRKRGLKIAILRPCMVYGEEEPHFMAQLIGLLKRRMLPIFGSGDKKLHLVSVENVVDVMVLCLFKDESYQGSYFIADKEVLSIKEIFNYITEILGAKPPICLSQSITNILTKLPFVGNRISSFSKDRVFSIERLREKLGYVPRVSVRDGLKRAVLDFENRR